VGTENRF